MSSGKFSRTLKDTERKTDNAPGRSKAKVELREQVLDWIGADQARVFDAFCGDGAMHDAVWKAASSYVGCDEKWYRDERTAFVADNRRVLRCVDLSQFNIFDLDAYGSPWEQALIIGDRRKIKAGEKIGVVITEGSGLKIKMGSYPLALCEIAGISKTAAGGSRSRDELLGRAINGFAKRMHCEIAHVSRARSRAGSAMVYAACMFKGSEA